MKYSYKIAIIMMIFALSLGGCRRGEEGQEVDIPQDVQLEQEVNQFLEENKVQLPEGSERANLADPTGAGGKGVVTTTDEGEMKKVTVLAALPDPQDGRYYAWVKKGEGDFELIGQLMAAKGGYLIEKEISKELGGNFVVSKEANPAGAPTNVVLEGSF
jgi:hypothetical protein